jgi:TonB family protein
MEWMIRINLIMILLAFIYRVSLHGARHFLFNRIYLLCVPLLAMFLPLTAELIVPFQPVYSALLNPAIIGINLLNTDSGFSSQNWVMYVYVSGLVVSFCVFLVRLYRALFHFNTGSTAHSFFQRIYLPEAGEEERNMMHLHEYAHSRFWHSADVLYYQLLRCFFWFNPAVYYLGNAVSEVNEYSADQYATKYIDDKTAYCELLLSETFGGDVRGITNPFHTSSSIIQRISMITQAKAQSVSMWKYIAVVPLLALTFFFSGMPYLFAQDTKPAKVTTIDQLPEFDGDLYKYLAAEVKYPEGARKDKVEGRVVLQFVVNAQGRIESIKNVTPAADARLVKEAIRVVSAMPAWKPAIDKGKKVSAEMTLPIDFRLK